MQLVSVDFGSFCYFGLQFGCLAADQRAINEKGDRQIQGGQIRKLKKLKKSLEKMETFQFLKIVRGDAEDFSVKSKKAFVCKQKQTEQSNTKLAIQRFENYPEI